MGRRVELGSSVALACLLAACSGGGGGPESAGSTPPPPATSALPTPMPAPATIPTSENLDTDEYRRSAGAVASNAIGAWQAGATGKGITIGFVDTGIDTSLSEFAGRIDSRSQDVAGSRGMGDPTGHGTAIVGIAAGARNDWGIQGVAYDATIFMARADNGCPASCTYDPDNVAQGIDAARAAGARVINLSMGGNESSAIADAVKRAANAGIVVIITAGNVGTDPSDLARQLANVAPSNVIIVGALGVTNPDGTVNYDRPATWTTPAAGSQNSFLSAPGWLVGGTSAPSASGYDLFSGTSFAAPVVTGAIALLAQAFPTLTAQQLVTLLYVTADDLGAPGVDTIYGRGRLNIGRAFQPVGTMRIADTGRSLVSGDQAIMPAAAGDAARNGRLAAIALDGFNRAFEVNLASAFREAAHRGILVNSLTTGTRSSANRIGPMTLAMTVANARDAGSTMQPLLLTKEEREGSRLLAAKLVTTLGNRSSLALGIGMSGGSLLAELPATSADTILTTGSETEKNGFATTNIRSAAYSYQSGRLRVMVAGETGEISGYEHLNRDPKYSSTSGSIEYQGGRASVRARVSRLAEDQTFLGGSLPSFLGAARSQTYFTDIQLAHSAGRGWTVSAAYRRGWTQSLNGQFSSSSFAADIAKRGLVDPEDQIALRVSQPLRIEKGGLGLLLPSSWDYSTTTAKRDVRRFSLSPSGRELIAELGYSRPFAGGKVTLNAFGRRHPGHDRHEKADLGFAVRFKADFGK